MVEKIIKDCQKIIPIKKAILACQKELIDKGFGENAGW
jgi:hypothetical protein